MQDIIFRMMVAFHFKLHQSSFFFVYKQGTTFFLNDKFGTINFILFCIVKTAHHFAKLIKC